jgi:glycine oxidase
MADTADVVVVGAGCIGGAIAYFLSREGLRVKLVDKEAIGSGASAHATGSLSNVYGPATSSEYLALIGHSSTMALETLPALQETSGVDVLHVSRPGLRVALNEADARGLQQRVAAQSGQGREAMEWLSGDEARRLEPRLSPQVLGAALVPRESQVDSYRLTLAFARAAECHGAEIWQREVLGLVERQGRITGVQLARGKLSCPNVVLAMGVATAHAAGWLHHPVPVRPLKGQSVRLDYSGPSLGYHIGGFAKGHLIHRGDGLFSAGSTEEEAGFDDRPTDAGRNTVLEWAQSVMPCLEEARVVQHLAGLRPLSRDDRPIIGPVPGLEGAYLATGHGRKGIHLSFVTGRIIADLILRGGTSLPLAPFLPGRFAPASARGG